ncbi:MAG: CPBP family intramembrane glutamic endopeptidase, partial [Candidatus Hermodarchaeota archaeon]
IGSMVILFAQDRRNIVETVKQAVSNFKKPVFFSSKSEERPKSIFVNVAQFFAVSWFFNIILLPIADPLDPFQLFPSIEELPGFLFSITVASVWEEIVFRVVFIGIPLLVIEWGLLRRASKTSPKDYIVGGYEKEGLTGLQVIFILVSSALFGWAHILIGDWGVWKFIPTFIAGLAFGYLFLTRGLHAAILFHFAVDYLAAVVVFMASLTFSGSGLETLAVNWNWVFILLVFLLIVFAGIAFWFVSGAWASANYIIGIIEYLKKYSSSSSYQDPKSITKKV